jgi:hypothetical protein
MTIDPPAAFVAPNVAIAAQESVVDALAKRVSVLETEIEEIRAALHRHGNEIQALILRAPEVTHSPEN